MSYVEESTDKFYKLYKFSLQTKIEKTRSFHKSKLKMSFSSLSLSSVEIKHTPV